MSEEIKNETTENTVSLTDDQVHHIYTELSDIDKISSENLAAAEKETEESNYTSDDNSIIDSNNIPGIKSDDEIISEIKEDENDIKDAISPYGLDDQATINMLKLIDDYKNGNRYNLYNRLPDAFKNIIDGMIQSEIKNASYRQIMEMKNTAATMLIDSFINDAKMSAAVDDFNTEMSSTVNEMNSEYDNMISNAIEDTFNRIDEIRKTDPAQAERIESIKNAFDNALTFERQLECAKNTKSFVFKNNLKEFDEHVRRFNTKVNNNTFGVKISKLEEIIPIIKSVFVDKYTRNDIKKFILTICKTAGDPKDLSGTAYNYRMISTICKYKYVAIDEKGKIIFDNISKVIDELKS